MEEVVGSIPTSSTKFLNSLDGASARGHDICVVVCFITRSLTAGPPPLFSLYANITELPEVLIKGRNWGRNWRGFGRSGSGDQTVHKMAARSLVAVQCAQVDGQVSDLNAGLEIRQASAAAMSVRRCPSNDSRTNTHSARTTGNTTITTSPRSQASKSRPAALACFSWSCTR